MKNALIIFLVFCSIPGFSQVIDDFSDGNFSINPEWNGSNTGGDFKIINNRLRSESNKASGNFYLSTANTLALNCYWEFWINLQFSTSGLNYADVYLISDKADLQNSMINGYFVRIGNTEDEISLYKRSGSMASSIRIIDGINGSVGSSNNTVKIRVSRDHLGHFTLEREVIGINSKVVNEGTFLDKSHINTTSFGIYIQQSTASFFQKHFFDDFRIGSLTTDSIAPILNMVTVIDSNTLEVQFNEAMDSLSVKNIMNYNIQNFPGNVIEINSEGDPQKFRIRLSEPLNTGNYSLIVVNVMDRNGNKIKSNNSFSFNYIKPYYGNFMDIIINEIFPDPTPQLGLPSAEYVELINISEKTISVNNWKFLDPSSSTTLGNVSLSPGDILILCAKTDTTEFQQFGNVMGISPWPSLNNTSDIIKLKNAQNKLIDSLSYSDQWYRSTEKKQGGWSLERIDPKSVCEGAFNWAASIDSTGGTPGKMNSVYVINYDLLPLRSDSIHRLSDTTLIVYFSKHLDKSTILEENFSMLPDAGKIKSIIADPDFKQVRITFTEKFLAEKIYKLSISGVKDCSGNPIQNTSSQWSFTIPAIAPQPAEKPDTALIYITEIFADPSPEVGLPLVEFVEIYNHGKDTINLERWTFSDTQTKSILKKNLIAPGEFLILCPAADTVQYKAFGKTSGLSPWPVLGNSSDRLVLKSHKNRTVDSIAYSDTWYNDSKKKQGGWSLERIDAFSKCLGILNWTASIDSLGGTPGRQNSVNIMNYDLIAFKADSLSIKSDTTLQVFFNKFSDINSIRIENFVLSPAAGQVKLITEDSKNRQLKITFSEKFISGTSYKLSISGLKDCSGNSIQNTSSHFSFTIPAIVPPPAEKRDTALIFMTEIFADPSPEVGLPLVEFVEIYNPGKDTINLERWTFSDTQTKSSFKKILIAPGEFLILCPAADTVQYKAFGKTAGLSPWPVLGNSSDRLVLKSHKNRTVDSIAYSDTWYKDQVKKSGGWSLEKIDLNSSSCSGFYNWAASTNHSGGTPGRKNSREVLINSANELKMKSVVIMSDSTLNILFNQIPDTSFLKASNFNIPGEIGRAKGLAIQADFMGIKLIFSKKFIEGTEYFLIADSLYTCSGKLGSATDHKISFGIPTIPEIVYPVIINEIFADPSPTQGLPEAEFVELFNPTSSSVSLNGLNFGDQSRNYTFTNGEIAAKSYLIICAVKDTSLFSSYGKVMGLPLWPDLNNESDVLILKNNKGKEINKLRYDSKWYRDSEKRKGGYSLELIDPESICLSFQNWTASRDSSGGTPGRMNSVYQIDYQPDTLKLIAIEIIDSLKIALTFNKTADSVKASLNSNYFLNNGVGNPINSQISGPDFTRVILSFREPLSKGFTYRLTANNIRDCRNTLLSAEFNSLEFTISRDIGKNDILITEILFNPRAGGSDFVEIFNNRDYTLDLKDLSIARIIKDSINSIQKLSKKQNLIEPGTYLALTPDPGNIKKEYFIKDTNSFIKINPFPAFNDDSGTAVLISKGQIIDQLSYSEKMHFSLLKTKEGVSLERSKLNRPNSDPGNLRSATSASGFASPGYKNSQHSEIAEFQENFTLASKTFSPDNDGFE
ncbi:MAG: lamin tail domain-containing protein, partial [Daejeonella sp.]|uniref:lamin tail domain-containing protein n=1 Tax=Daejeonella sp. TaxID=2805397 RepID=UPI002733F9B6